MDHLDDFYLVLPSNSSMAYFPDNTTTCYTTHLSREVRLTGDWLVGLAEIHIPSTVVHIQENDAFYHFILGDEHSSENDDICYFPHGVYESIEQLANEINKVKNVHEHQLLVPADFQKGYYTVKRTCECEQPHYTKFNEKFDEFSDLKIQFEAKLLPPPVADSRQTWQIGQQAWLEPFQIYFTSTQTYANHILLVIHKPHCCASLLLKIQNTNSAQISSNNLHRYTTFVYYIIIFKTSL